MLTISIEIAVLNSYVLVAVEVSVVISIILVTVIVAASKANVSGKLSKLFFLPKAKCVAKHK